MITTDTYLSVKGLLEASHLSEIQWAYGLELCRCPAVFGMEACWVILNSGFRYSVAEPIWRKKIRPALISEGKIGDEHFRGRKQISINDTWSRRVELLTGWQCSGHAVSWLADNVSGIGQVTMYHLAKNLGVDCIKPDRHLLRLAKLSSETPKMLGDRLSQATGDRLAVVDTVLWRAAEQGIL